MGEKIENKNQHVLHILQANKKIVDVLSISVEVYLSYLDTMNQINFSTYILVQKKCSTTN